MCERVLKKALNCIKLTFDKIPAYTLLQHFNRAELLLMFIGAAVLLLLWHVKMSAVKKVNIDESSWFIIATNSASPYQLSFILKVE